MKIELIYIDLFEYSGQFFIEQKKDGYDFCVIDYGNVMRTHINNKTILGQQIRDYVNNGELLPKHIAFEAIKHEIESKKCENILIKNYPRDKDQVDLFTNYCSENNIRIVRAWYMKSLNVMTNLDSSKKHSQMAIKYNSHEQIKLGSERMKTINKNAIKEIEKYCEVIVFESE